MSNGRPIDSLPTKEICLFYHESGIMYRTVMMIESLKDLFYWSEDEEVLDTEYEPLREWLRLAGLFEEKLQKMDPDDWVAALKQANP